MTVNWLLDNGTSHHVTSHLGNHSLYTPYDGPDDIMIDNGMGFPITHIGYKISSSPSNSFKLKNVLCVPPMQKNLIYVSKCCHQNNTSIKFSPSSFFVKDLTMGITLLQSQAKDGVYELPIFPSQASPIITFSSTNSSPTVWHHRLVHPSSSIFKNIFLLLILNCLSPPISISIANLHSSIKVINYHFPMGIVIGCVNQ